MNKSKLILWLLALCLFACKPTTAQDDIINVDDQLETKHEEPKKEEEQTEEKKNKEKSEPKPQNKEEETTDETEGKKPDTKVEDNTDKPNEKQSLTLAEPAKRSPIFLLEFTGQKCLYCPSLSRLLKKKQERYGKQKYLYVALHSEERFSILPANLISLYSEEANRYGKDVKKPKGLPYLHYNSLREKPSDLPFTEMLLEPDLLDCQANAHLLPNKKINLELKTILRRDRQEFIKGKAVDILIWIMENDIIAYQQDSESKAYHTYPKHQHIFRSSLNTHWGEAYQIGQPYNRTFDLPTNILKAKNCEIVVIFLDHQSKMVLDAGCFELK